MKNYQITKFFLLTFALLSFAVSFNAPSSEAGNETGYAGHPYTVIDAEKLKEMKANEKNLVIIDSRGGKYFDGELIKGASQLSAGDTDEENLKKLGAKEKDTKIVFYCTNVNCPASAKAAAKASSLGYTNLYKYPGGIEDWKDKGLPITKI